MADEDTKAADGADKTETGKAADTAKAAPVSLIDKAAPADTKGEGEGDKSGAKPGAKERPADIPENFWDATKGEVKVDALVKSWKDSRAALTAKGAAAEKPPEKAEDYKLPMPEGASKEMADKIAGDETWKAIQASAHKAGVSQKQLDALAAPYLEALIKTGVQLQSPEAQKAAIEKAMEDELKALGKEGPALLRDLGAWGNGLKDKGLLSPDEHREFLITASTAPGVRMLAKLRELSGERAMPIDPSALEVEGGSMQDYYDLMGAGKTAEAAKLLERLDKAGLVPEQPVHGIMPKARGKAA